MTGNKVYLSYYERVQARFSQSQGTKEQLIEIAKRLSNFLPIPMQMFVQM